MASIAVRSVSFVDIADLHATAHLGAPVQIVHHSILPRGFADAYALLVDGRMEGFAGVWIRHHPGRITSWYLSPSAEPSETELLRTLQEESGAHELEVQTNVGSGAQLLRDTASETWTEKLLFEDGGRFELAPPGVRLRPRSESDDGPDGEWVLEQGSRLVGAGGVMTHYNHPFADLYMEVIEDMRGQGYGSYLVQELRRVCIESGLIPAARCDEHNEASRRALLRGGLVECGRLVAGSLTPLLR